MAAASPDPPGVARADPLGAALRACVVRIDGDGRFRGSGFWVAPGEVLTCAHVVAGCRDVTVGWQDDCFPATTATALPDLDPHDPAAGFYPLPDVALLRVAAAIDHPCVRLDTSEPVGGPPPDVLRLDAFTFGEHAPDAVVRSAVTTHYEGVVEEHGWHLLKVKGGQVLGGFSGAPLLNSRTGRVCALVESSRGERSDLGGFAVPLSGFLDELEGLRERNEAHHRAEAAWDGAVEAERRGAAERAGLRDRLPLLTPRAELRWAPGDSPTDLLRPRHGVVPFIGREPLLDELMLWRDGDDRLGLVVLAGGGGFGKTRTAAEVCSRAEGAGWTAGLLGGPGLSDRPGDALEELAGWPGRLLVAVDYAETRPDVVGGLLVRLLRRTDRPAARVVLVVRQAMTRRQLEDLFATGDARDELTGLVRHAEMVHLDAEPHELDRLEVFEAARREFARRLGASPGGPAPALRAEQFARPLFASVAGLLAVGGAGVDVDGLSPDELMAEVLDRHEAEYWDRRNRHLGVGLDRSDQRRAVALGALLGADTEDDALRVVRLVPGFDDVTGERQRTVARWLGGLYGAGRLDVTPTILPLEPDSLAEALLAREMAASPNLVGRALDTASDSQLARALLVLTRTVAGREPLAGQLRAALDDRLAGILRRLTAPGQPDERLAAAVHLAVDAVHPEEGAIAARPELPKESVALARLAAEITATAVGGLREAVERDPGRLPDLAAALNDLALRLAAVGRPGEGLAASEEAVEHQRTLAAADPDRFLPDLARALDSLAGNLGARGRPAEALEAMRESVGHHRTLTATDADRYLPDLATALTNLSVRLAFVGRAGEALEAIDEAVGYYRTLAAADADRYLPGLATALDNRSIRLAELGRSDDALGPSQEAVRHYRTLAAANADRYLPHLAIGLNGLSNHLANLGRPHDALEAIAEVVGHYRTLAAANPEAFLPSLAMSLSNLSVRLAHVGRLDDGLTHMEESVSHFRALAATDPDQYLSYLAWTLTNFSNRLSNLGRLGDALTVIEEALGHHRTVAAANPDVFLPGLAMSLNNCSILLAELGRPAEALTAAEEAVAHHRTLAAANPDRFLPELAMSLTNLSERLAALDRPGEAGAAGEEALGHRRTLAAANPDRFLPDLAEALTAVSNHLASEGRVDDALEAAEEAVRHRRTEAATNPDHALSYLAWSLDVLSARLGDAGRTADALKASQEAVELYRTAAAANPDRFLPDLAQSLENLCSRLADLGRAPEVAPLFAQAQREFAGDNWAEGVLLLSQARWHRGSGALGPCIADAWSAVQRLSPRRDPLRRGEARSLLRSLPREDQAAFARAWTETVGRDQPVWLRHHDHDPRLGEQVMEWVAAASWEDSRAVLAAHSGELLGDEAEAALEHLMDDRPGDEALARHGDILRTARAEGIDAAYARLRQSLQRGAARQLLDDWTATRTWPESAAFLEEHAGELLTDIAGAVLADLVAAAPDDARLLTHLGLLTLCRLDGPEAAYALVADPGRLAGSTPDLSGAGDTVRTLAVARMAAGVHPDAGAAQCSHALAALVAGEEDEAEQAVIRCAEVSASWERRAHARRIAELAVARPALSAGLHQLEALLGKVAPAAG